MVKTEKTIKTKYNSAFKIFIFVSSYQMMLDIHYKVISHLSQPGLQNAVYSQKNSVA